MRKYIVSGIIPARAGFTSPPTAAGAAGTDHPRSRGVYASARVSASRSVGSSPLARGLLSAPVRPAGPPGDHPRSRGVYWRPGARPGRAPGSSPLARGLPGTDRGGAGVTGIIPARAGFTQSSCAPGSHRADHPRSRGVYPTSPPSGSPASGSSPLARGLPHSRPVRQCVLRIIPARAGFTRRPGHRRCGAADHPRSRGVYDLRTALNHLTAGSSPLARGLRSAGGERRGDRGIIPARAGFTRGTGSGTGRGEDHPRSRGVYRRRDPALGRGLGSSPLARGLLLWPARSGAWRRIIPARAGFT